MSRAILRGWAKMWPTTALAGALVLLLLLHGPALMSAVWGNAGMLMLRDALLARAESVSAVFSTFNALEGDAKTTQAVQSFRRAVALDGDNSAARWALGRAALATGDAATAVDALDPLEEGMAHNPLLYQDVLTALSYANKPAQVIALYASVPPLQRTQVVSDVLALAYLDTAQSSGGEEALLTAREFRPGDLYANYSLWRAALTGEDLASATTYSETLVYFPPEALHPTNERLLAYTAQVIPQLYQAQLWDRPRVLNVVSFLVWQHNGATSVERLLTQLGQRYPAEPDWPFHLAELYQRRGDLDQAQAAYGQVLAMAPEYAQAYLRLGMVAEAGCAERTASCEGLREAARWYNAYHDRRPDDLSGLSKLAEAYAALGKPEAAPLQQELNVKTDDRRVVAELLGVPIKDLVLGPNWVENGGFEERIGGKPNKWIWWTMFSREPFGDAAFAGGGDGLLPFEGRATARVDGFWMKPQENESPARTGFWHWDKAGRALQPITLSNGEPYVFSFDYRTVGLAEGAARVWVSNDPDVLWAGYHGLPATDGAWHHFVAVGWNRADAEGAIYPLLSSFGAGSVAYDNVGLRPVELSAEATIEANEALFWVTAGDHQ